MNRYDDDQLAAWLHDGPHDGTEGALDRVLSITRHARQRPGWLVALAGGTVAIPETTAWHRRLPWRSVTLLAAAVLLMSLLAGAIAVGSGLVRVTILRPDSSALPAPSHLAEATRPPSPDATFPWIVFLRQEGDRFQSAGLWAMRADGTGAREIWPSFGLPYVTWSQDGTRLLAVSGYDVYVAEVGDDIGPFVDTGINTGGETACGDKSDTPMPCQDVAFTYAPDGEHIAFVRRCTHEIPGCNLIATMDLRTGEVTELDETRTTARYPLALPDWSPDGTQIAYTRETDQRVISQGGIPRSELWIINADGSNLHRLDMGNDISAQDPQWSPDGTRIAFTSVTWPTETEMVQRVYTVNADPDTSGGAGLSLLFSGGEFACCAEWINNSQLRVWRTDLADLGEDFPFYAVEDQGGSGGLLLSLDEALSAIDRPGRVTTISVPGDPGRTFFWQPAP